MRERRRESPRALASSALPFARRRLPLYRIGPGMFSIRDARESGFNDTLAREGTPGRVDPTGWEASTGGWRRGDRSPGRLLPLGGSDILPARIETHARSTRKANDDFEARSEALSAGGARTAPSESARCDTTPALPRRSPSGTDRRRLRALDRCDRNARSIVRFPMPGEDPDALVRRGTQEVWS